MDKEANELVIFYKSFHALLENHTIVKGPTPIPFPKLKNNRENCSWFLPPVGWLKANFDGAAKGNLGRVGVGGIIRNEHGKGIVAFVAPIGCQTNHYVEALDSHQIIKLAKDVGVKCLWLERDSKNIID